MALNFKHKKGDTFDGVNFQMKINAINYDLSNCILRMQFRKEYGGVIIKSFTSVNNSGITITDALNGLFKINKQIIDVPAFNYLYDIELDKQDGTVKTYIDGIFSITNDVTR